MDNLDLYAILGVTKNSTDAEIKKVKSKSSWTTVEKKIVLMKISLVTQEGRRCKRKLGKLYWGDGEKLYAKKKLQIFNVKVE